MVGFNGPNCNHGHMVLIIRCKSIEIIVNLLNYWQKKCFPSTPENFTQEHFDWTIRKKKYRFSIFDAHHINHLRQSHQCMSVCEFAV